MKSSAVILCSKKKENIKDSAKNKNGKTNTKSKKWWQFWKRSKPKKREELLENNFIKLEETDGFDDIEHRIANMDKEHTKYVRATVTRLNYLLSGETDTKGLVVQLLNRISAEENGVKKEEKLRKTAERMNLSYLEILSEKSLYKRRKSRTDFISKMETEEETEDLNREEVLKMNRIQMRYSRAEIEEFIQAHMTGDIMDAGAMKDMTDEDFEKLILAYDYSTRRNSKYAALNEEDRMVENGRYRYPDLKFIQRRP